MLVALESLAADQPGMAMLQFEHARCRMKQNRNIEVGDLFIEREQYFVVEIAVAPAAVELDRFETELFDRTAQFLHRFLDIRQINPGATDETIVAADIFRHVSLYARANCRPSSASSS